MVDRQSTANPLVEKLIAEVKRLQKNNAEFAKLNAELLGLNEHLIEEIEASLIQGAHRCPDGWYDTMAISQWRDLGELLVKLGRWERKGDDIGRRGFYRVKPK